MANSNRKDLTDKFYTKRNIVSQLISNICFDKFDTIIEPSAGDGAFSDSIPNCIAIDIDPQKEYIKRANFLTHSFDVEPQNTLVIGNPPFGRQGSMAFKFINRAAKIADTIAFILPKSFMKASMKNRMPILFHLVYEKELSDDSFIYKNEDYKVPSVFQIWERRNEPRSKIKKEDPIGFCYVKKNQNPDIAIRRVGINAGDSFLNINNRSEQSHYFIRVQDKIDPEWLANKIAEMSFEEASYTTGPNSISKRELNKQINRCIKTKFDIDIPKFW